MIKRRCCVTPIKVRLARLHRRIADIRRDAVHKLTTMLTRRFAAIGVEDLNVRGMVKNRRLARSVGDAALGEVRRQLGYKQAVYGSRIVVHDRWYPSSKLYSVCGAIRADLPLSVRAWNLLSRLQHRAPAQGERRDQPRSGTYRRLRGIGQAGGAGASGGSPNGRRETARGEAGTWNEHVCVCLGKQVGMLIRKHAKARTTDLRRSAAAFSGGAGPARLRRSENMARALGSAALTAVMLVLASPQPADAGEGRRGVKQVRTFLELQQEEVVRQQWDLSCGAAALATILTYQHGDAVSERVIAETMLERTDSRLVQARLGFSLLDLKRFAEIRGYVAVGYAEVTLNDLAELGPAIVPVRLTTYDHFVVFRGRLGDRVLLADPAYGNRIMHVATFEEVWRDNLAFIVERPGGAASPDRLSARPEDFRVPSAATLRTVLLN